jgi:hypothetical protein
MRTHWRDIRTLPYVQADILDTVIECGAVTERRVVHCFGPRAGWEDLVKQGWLRRYETAYGTLLALGPTWRLHCVRSGRGQPLALSGPSLVMDRAYQVDALTLLAQEGYHCHSWVHAARWHHNVRIQSGQITHYVMRAPEAELETIRQQWGPVSPPQPDSLYSAARGYPSMYATVSGQGITSAGVRRLLHNHQSSITSWRSPLLVVVPDPLHVRAVARATWAAEDRARHRWSAGQPDRVLPPRLRVIALPLDWLPELPDEPIRFTAARAPTVR